MGRFIVMKPLAVWKGRVKMGDWRILFIMDLEGVYIEYSSLSSPSSLFCTVTGLRLQGPLTFYLLTFSSSCQCRDVLTCHATAGPQCLGKNLQLGNLGQYLQTIEPPHKDDCLCH